MERIYIFDTTLRDGEQSPGASLTVKEKIEIARHLELLNVDVIEAGFAISSPGDFEGIQGIAETVKKPIVASLARCLEKDIEAAAKALEKAKKKRIHVFLATSEIHRKYKFRKAKEEILKLAQEGVKIAKSFVEDVEFSPEDASRTEPEFLKEVIEAVIEAGATVINIPDTVGYAVPHQFGELIKYIKENVSNIEKVIISVHCHNDLGLAVANSLAAIMNGARQVECTINGIGERAGNASLEEIVMNLKVRNDYYKKYTNIDTTKIYSTSKVVSKFTGLAVQKNKAIVGENAFAHESGIHQDGILKERSTYEIMRPEDVGFSSSKLILGKHSGRHAFVERLKELGLNLSKEDIEIAFQNFKKLADKKKHVYDEDIISIVENRLTQIPETFKLIALQCTSGSTTIPTATVMLEYEDGSRKEDASIGDGPVDAVYKTIERITGIKTKLVDYQIRAITQEKDAMGEVNIKLEYENKIFYGSATGTDIIDASARAYLNALNKIVRHKK